MSTLAADARRLSPPAISGVWQLAWPLVMAVVAGLVMHYGVGPAINPFIAKLILVIGINVVLAVSLTVVNGFTGQFSMGHAGFMAVGGYVAAAITYYGSMRLLGTADFAGGQLSFTGSGEDPPLLATGDLLFVVSCLVGGLAAALAGYIVGLPSLRLRGDYLAIVTLGFGEIVRVLLQGTYDQIQPWKARDAAQVPLWKLPLMVGGPKGFNLLPTYTTLFWVWTAAALTLIICYRLKSSSAGRAFLAIREDEIAAQAMGVNTTKYKVRAFVVSAFFAGVAGGLYAMDIGAISAGDLGFLKSFDIIIMVVLGGLGSISGAAIAAAILTILPEALRSPPTVLSVWALLPLGIGVLLWFMARRRARALIILAIVVLSWEIVRGIAIAGGLDLSKYRMILYALALIVMMITRPQGIMGLRELWELRPVRRAAKGAA